MKVIIAGSRSITRIGAVIDAIHKSGWADKISEVISGTARGVDQNGEWVARNVKGLLRDDVKITRMPADWDRYGLRAGAIRNAEMATYADALILVWDGKSNGSRIMYFQAKRKNIPVYVHDPQ